MKNDVGNFVDLYIPRKCSASNRVITADEHGSAQISMVQVDQFGVMIPGQNISFALCERVRQSGEGDRALYELVKEEVKCTATAC